VSEAESGLSGLFHVYDAAMRLWAETSLVEAARWLDPSLHAVPARDFEKLSSVLVTPVIKADLLLRTGPGRLMHVEYETTPEAGLVERMLDYRIRMMREYPGHRLTQYVVVLGSGTVIGFDDQERYGFTVDVRAVYLRDHEPAEFLNDVLLAPFAVLARGSPAEREQALAAAIRFLRDCDDPRARTQLQVLDGLAGIVLDRSVVERIEKENSMSIEPLVQFYLDTEVGQRLKDLGRDEGRMTGLAEGHLSGLAEGREQARERLLLALLRTRFGDRPEVRPAAVWLSRWDEEAAVNAITTASDPLHLLRMEPPGEPRS
jgi:hypothetical protein